jgi:hypothetical protein
MTKEERERCLSGAEDIVIHAEMAIGDLKELRTACASGDKVAARLSLRKAISELEVARGLLCTERIAVVCMNDQRARSERTSMSKADTGVSALFLTALN